MMVAGLFVGTLVIHGVNLRADCKKLQAQQTELKLLIPNFCYILFFHLYFFRKNSGLTIRDFFCIWFLF